MPSYNLCFHHPHVHKHYHHYHQQLAPLPPLPSPNTITTTTITTTIMSTITNNCYHYNLHHYHHCHLYHHQLLLLLQPSLLPSLLPPWSPAPSWTIKISIMVDDLPLCQLAVHPFSSFFRSIIIMKHTNHKNKVCLDKKLECGANVNSPGILKVSFLPHLELVFYWLILMWWKCHREV